MVLQTTQTSEGRLGTGGRRRRFANGRVASRCDFSIEFSIDFQNCISSHILLLCADVWWSHRFTALLSHHDRGTRQLGKRASRICCCCIRCCCRRGTSVYIFFRMSFTCENTQQDQIQKFCRWPSDDRKRGQCPGTFPLTSFHHIVLILLE